MSTRDPIRELAEEIAEESAAHVYNKSLNDLTPEEYATFEACADRWEARLRSALPTVSSLLGELGVVHSLLHQWFGLFGVGEHTPEGLDEATAAALSGDAGRLAGEVLVAVRRGRLDTKCKTLKQFAAHLRRIVEADAALEDAFPELREEVEGEPDAHGGPGEDERGRTWMGRPRGDGYL